MSQPGFNPSYRKLMSSHTDEFWLNETDLSVDDYKYIYYEMSTGSYFCFTSIFFFQSQLV